MKKAQKKVSVKKAPAAPVAAVTSLPTGCPKCGCTDRTNKESVINRDIKGTTFTGFTYTQVKWSYVSCRECGGRYRIVEYLRPTSRDHESGSVN
jgi:predicted nucleic-acid-binding Zn-ribbon protein